MNRDTLPVLQRGDRGGVAILTLNRPAKLNALSDDLLAAIMRVLDDIEIDPAVRVIVFTGEGADVAIDDGLAIEEAAFARIVSTRDAREGVAAFLGKRAPRLAGFGGGSAADGLNTPPLVADTPQQALLTTPHA